WSGWLTTAVTIALAVLWAVPIAWAAVVSLRPPGDSLGRGDIWFSSRITAESYERATTLAPFFPSWNAYSAAQFAERVGVERGVFAALVGVALLVFAGLIAVAADRWHLGTRTAVI